MNVVYAATHHFGDPRRGSPARPILGVSADARGTVVQGIAAISRLKNRQHGATTRWVESGGNRLHTEMGYELPIGRRFVGTPRVGLQTSRYGRTYRLGYAVQALERSRFNL